MISSSEIRALLAAAFVACLPLSSLAQNSVMQRGDVMVRAGERVDDVVVADGNLVVKGAVNGSVFAVNGDVMLSPGARVSGNLTVLGGSLWLSRGSSVGGEVNVFSGKAHIEEGAVTGSDVRAMEEVSSLTPEKLSTISRYLIFSRRTPPPDFPLSRLEGLDLEDLRLRKYRDQSTLQLDLYELGEVPVGMDEVAESRQLDFRGHDVRLRVCVFRFSSPEEAQRLWEGMRVKYEESTSHSVHNSLGGGAHWFFRHDESTYGMWCVGDTLQAVMVRHDDDHPEKDEWRDIENLRDQVIVELFKFYDSAEKTISEED